GRERDHPRQLQPAVARLGDAPGSRIDTAARLGGAPAMKIEGTRSFAAPRRVLWEVLNDPQQMAGVMPGVEHFDVQDDDHWTANVVVPLGLGGLKMKIAFETTERREPEYAKLHAKGQGVGALMN